MENKEPKTVRISTVILLFIIIVLLITLVLMYMYYNSEPKNEIATNTSKQPEQMNTINTEVSERKEVNINSSLVKEIYDYIPAIEESLYDENTITLPNAYQTKKVICNDLDSKLLLANAFFKADIDMNDEKYKDGMDAEIIEELALKNYNEKIKATSFSVGAVSLNYSNGTYDFSNGGYSDIYIGHIRNIEEAYEENDELYIVDTYLMSRSQSGDIQVGDNSETIKIYDSSDNEKTIAEDYIKDFEEIDSTEEYVKQKYSSKAKKYKHTFKKNDDGEYYWYSSEPYTE